MASKREEERNEKIIRGLMKLPPNRRCINCNNLGPQYVCTTFWTFVCMICSGIHREFTHRVKSVSMSKFTSQEVDALQNGGNQRAREIYLKDWDLQRQRLPNSSDVDKVREFIKAVYVGRKYAGGSKLEKPPSDLQGERDETRRASSYHSYSQSPPYDFQYEDRLNRKQGGSINRKPGSDRGLFNRKAASFVYSPGRFSDHIYEDRFINEGSSSRVSQYSVSSGGESFRSAPHSPNLQKEDVFSSPTSNSSWETADGLQRPISSTKLEAVPKNESDKLSVPRPQRAMSSETITECEVPTLPPSQLSAENSGVSPLGIPVPIAAPAIELFQASTTLDLFQSPEVASVPPQNVRAPQTSVSSSLSFFSENSENSHALNFNEKLPELSESINEGWATFESHQPPGPSILTTVASGSRSEVGISAKHPNSVSSSNAGSQWPNVQNSNLHVSASLASRLWNEDMQNTHASTMASSQPWNAFEEIDEKEYKNVEKQGINLQFSAERTSCTTDPSLGSKTAEPLGPSILKTVDSRLQSDDGISAKQPDFFSSLNAGLQGSNVQNTNFHVSSSLASHLWNEDWQNTHASTITSSQPWNAFEEVNEKEHKHVEEQGIESQFSAERTSCTTDHFPSSKIAEASSADGLQKFASNEGFSFPTLPPHVPSSFQFNQSIHPFMTDVGDVGQKSSNPFDSPFDSEFEGNNGFFGMNSLQAALPSMPLSSPYTGGLDESWYPPSNAQAPTTQLTNIPAHGPVGSIGGNPFA